jgi:hypothetical protein
MTDTDTDAKHDPWQAEAWKDYKTPADKKIDALERKVTALSWWLLILCFLFLVYVVGHMVTP